MIVNIRQQIYNTLATTTNSPKIIDHSNAGGKSLPTYNTSNTAEISDTGKALPQQGTNQTDSNDMLAIYKNNPEAAAKAAYNYAHNNDLLFIPTPTSRNISDSHFLDGTPITDKDYMSRFKEESNDFRQQRINLYEAEKSKGTPEIEILSKIFNSYDNLPDSYKLKIGYV